MAVAQLERLRLGAFGAVPCTISAAGFRDDARRKIVSQQSVRSWKRLSSSMSTVSSACDHATRLRLPTGAGAGLAFLRSGAGSEEAARRLDGPATG